ncbi:MAG: preprotein translocase subunit YajC [Polyangiaceae bacterium]
MSFAASSPGSGELAFIAQPATLMFSAFQAVPPRPEAGTVQPAAPEPSGAAPRAQGGFAESALPMLLMVAPVLILLFFTSRSQQKKQAATLANLKKGDRVITQGGLVGRLVELGDRFAKLEISPGVKVEILKSGILGADSAETQAAAEKK